MTDTQLHRVHTDVEQTEPEGQRRNRLWWERMPMTYADWNSNDRIPKTAAEFKSLGDYLLARSPFLTQFFAAGKFDGLHVLDLGCGVGVLSCLLARHGADVTAADITEQAVRLTAENVRAQQASVGVVRTDAEAMGFADRSFDYVLSWGVLHHSPHTEQAFAEVARVLKPGGRGLIMVYHKTSLVYYLRGLYWLLARGKIWQGYNIETVQDFCVDGYYHRHFDAREFAQALSGADLTPVYVTATQQDDPILPFVPAGLDRWLKKRFGWYLLAEVVRA
jgi:2-polyprenyl-3-methyl-5-hydroxy-6-metoxy-1,4-benzoquinol methylase